MVDLVVQQVDVASPPVPTRPAALDQTGRLEHVEVMSEQVRRHPNSVLQLLRRPVRTRQMIDDRQAGRLTQCGVHRRPLLQRPRSTMLTAFHSSTVEATLVE